MEAKLVHKAGSHRIKGKWSAAISGRPVAAAPYTQDVRSLLRLSLCTPPHSTIYGRPSGRCRVVLLLLALLGVLGCRTAPPLPVANLKEPGWTVREGQAVWRRNHKAPEIAGDLLVATRNDGRAFVQFSKTPLPLVIAQSTPKNWEVEVPTQNKRYSGHGRPPARLIFLYLPRALLDEPLPKNWSWRRLENNGWHLENRSNGESLEGYFSQ